MKHWREWGNGLNPIKIVKPTFESFLKEVDEVFIRIDTCENILTLVAGGINTSGTWIEFASKLDKIKTLSDIAKSLKIMVYFVEEEQKHWDLEKPHHVLIREYNRSLN